MKLGAQFYSLRERCKTDEGLKACFAAMKNIGYEVAQMSAIWPRDPYFLKECSDEFSMPITCTHAPLDRILDDTDNLIRDHKIFDCPVIGLGMMPKEYLESIEGAREFLKKLEKPIAKIKDAGMRFAYHNHHFEFEDFGGVCIYDVLFEESPDMNFILDTYWVKHAGRNCTDYVKLLGESGRMTNIHFKDMKDEPKGAICPCGDGVIDFAPIASLCKEYKIPYALVEQDNAPQLGDEIEQMKSSFEHLKHLF